MTKVRKENPVLVYGQYELLQEAHPTVYAFTRMLDDEKLLVLLNFSEEASTIQLPDIPLTGKQLINNYEKLEVENNTANLLPYQAVILAVE